MRNKHNELTDDTFKGSIYIKKIEELYDIKDFRKEYREQYDMILDIYQVYILLSNCFFSDNDLRTDDRVRKAYKLLKDYFKVNDMENVVGVKYSVRDIQDICDKHCRHIYNLMSEWYYSLYGMVKNNSFDNKLINKIKKEILEEMELLEYSQFDSVVIENITYQKHNIKNYRKYKKYLCKFDNIYGKSNEYKEKYKKDFYDRYGINLTDKEINTLGLLFKLLASLDNGLVNIINDYKLNKELTDMDHDDIELFYLEYLKSLNMYYSKENYDETIKYYEEYLKWLCENHNEE